MQKGFSLMEIVVVIAIMSMIGTFVVIAYAKFNSSQALEKDALQVISVLNQARSLTLSSKGNSQYGVHFGSSEVVLFTGENFQSEAESNIPVALNRLVSVSADLSGGGSEVVFERLTGRTAQSGTVALSLLGEATSTRSLIIYETGVVEEN